MTKPISPKNVNKNDTLENTQTKLCHIKIEKNIEISNDSNNDDSQPKLHQIKTNKIIEISSALENDPNAYDIMHYWYEYLQLAKVDGNIFFDLNKWLNNQHLKIIMQILYVENLLSLGYEQHTFITKNITIQ
jgi:hypothetical protein